MPALHIRKNFFTRRRIELYGEVSAMLGRLEVVEDTGKVELLPELLGGLPLLRGVLRVNGSVSQWRVRRRVRKLKRLLEGRGVRRLVVPEGSSWGELFGDFGRVEPLPFYRAAMDMLALGSLAAQGVAPERGVVALSAPRLSSEVTAAAERLCPQVRGLLIDVPGDGARFAGWLHREYGLPVAPPAGADVTVALAPGGGRWGQVVELSEERVDLGGLTLRAPELELPCGCEAQLLAALWEAGLLERGSLQVE